MIDKTQTTTPADNSYSYEVWRTDNKTKKILRIFKKFEQDHDFTLQEAISYAEELKEALIKEALTSLYNFEDRISIVTKSIIYENSYRIVEF